MIERAEADRVTPSVPLVPVGFRYVRACPLVDHCADRTVAGPRRPLDRID